LSGLTPDTSEAHGHIGIASHRLASEVGAAVTATAASRPKTAAPVLANDMVLRNMKRFLCLVVAFLCGCTRADHFAAPTAQNSVPTTLWIEYSQQEGVDFRLQHFTADRDPSGRVITAYFLNWRFDASGEWHELSIPTESWVRFRQSLREAQCDKWTSRTFRDASAKAFWRIQIVYPDVTIEAAEADVPSLQRDFEPVRMAVRELTAGRIN